MSELTTDAPDIPANDLILAKEMADLLNRHYPGHMWAVTVNGAQGVADIRNLALVGNYGYRLRLVANYSASDYARRVVRAGGEILERYKLSRGKANESQIATLPMNTRGQTIGDLSK